MARARVSQPAISISIRADRPYREAVRRVAKRHGLTVAEATRQALDLMWRDQISREQALIHADSGQTSVQCS